MTPSAWRGLAAGLLLTGFTLVGGRPALAQDRDSSRVIKLDPVTVTATRVEKTVFATPAPIAVIDSAALRRAAADTPVDLFRELPGLDVTGVGPSQARPVIRGQRGQRILLLSDGLRMNNSRRQQDFGEIPALVDVNQVDRVEVVRGPASVLYGTDAIGGVINLITVTPPIGIGDALHGSLGYRYGSAETEVRPTGSANGRLGRFRFGLGATYRESDSYDAPAGNFGGLRLSRDTRVHDTGVQDENYRAQAGYTLGENHDLLLGYDRYVANDAGFGYVDAADFGRPDDPFIQIRYPHQRVNRYTARYRGQALNSLFADRVDIAGYTQSNVRNLDLNIFIPFGNGAPPGAGVASTTNNFTDLSTWGFRAEAIKVLAGRHTLTYGMDFFRDRSENTDVVSTTIVGFGPPQTQVDSTPQVPNASFRSAGVFAQTDLALTPSLSLILGGRYQDVKAATRPTPRITDPLVESTDRTVVGTANLLYRVTDNLNLVGSVGRGFRSPNLVERFFQGVTPEGSGYQSRNPDLKPETSLNVEVGAKYRRAGLYLEAFAFRNTIHDGIRIAPTGDSVGGFAEYQNINVDQLRFTGFELSGDLNLLSGVSLGLNYAHLRSRDVLNPKNPVGETYADKVNTELRYRSPGGRLALSYGVRFQGDQKDANLGTSPIGSVLPSFTVHTARASYRLFSRGRFNNSVGLTLQNVTDALYAESANASFFRPEPGRRLTVAWTTGF